MWKRILLNLAARYAAEIVENVAERVFDELTDAGIDGPGVALLDDALKVLVSEIRSELGLPPLVDAESARLRLVDPEPDDQA